MLRDLTIIGVEKDKANPDGFGGMCSRSIPMQRDEIDFEKGIDTIATTENPALVMDWERWEAVREVLPMKYCIRPEGDKVPLCDTHMRFSIENVLGSAREFVTKGNALICKTFVSASEESTRQKIKERHVDSVSIGYMTDKNETIEVPAGKAVTVDGVAYVNDFTDGIRFLVRTMWKVRELSLVPIGADAAAKFRAMNAFNADALAQEMGNLKKEIETIKQQNIQPTVASAEEIKTEQAPAAVDEGLKVSIDEYNEFVRHEVQTEIQNRLQYLKGKVK